MAIPNNMHEPVTLAKLGSFLFFYKVKLGQIRFMKKARVYRVTITKAQAGGMLGPARVVAEHPSFEGALEIAIDEMHAWMNGHRSANTAPAIARVRTYCTS